ncbi:hypothetical protein GH714_005568 [Hevea brasiliensis]|uniref:Uncharacterized protein n=1 Tax=Hevea brasiliensis TaxID=3981 RepID=A0A6A6KZA6_HEVBR|nr:hypothetical protein GH714_005568 [Hevea brasiliensis]
MIGSDGGEMIMTTGREHVNRALAAGQTGTRMTVRGAQGKGVEWQELRRKKEESERDKHGEAANVDKPNTGKTWTLEGDSDDDEAPPTGTSETDMELDENSKPDKDVGDAMVVDFKNGTAALENDGDDVIGDEEIDPLDAFMNSMVLPEVEKLNNAAITQAVDDNKVELKKRTKRRKEAMESS